MQVNGAECVDELNIRHVCRAMVTAARIFDMAAMRSNFASFCAKHRTVLDPLTCPMMSTCPLMPPCLLSHTPSCAPLKSFPSLKHLRTQLPHLNTPVPLEHACTTPHASLCIFYRCVDYASLV